MVASTTVELLPDEACGLLAAIADPVRFGIVRQLATGRRCVCELQGDEPIAPNLLSYHLRVLREAGLITAYRRGRWMDYELVVDALERLNAALPARPAPRGGDHR